ncbi:MAG: hypothetical protein A3F83_15180 [Candidatus Glassbacteria bacterium RIFCSPLOWO2_12_FULL_58_11]|uniref:DUF1353 domain-containing protein n=1 Tax=Candidatus Glassbacteria bacterium RIFCSPLOWO2_12_FULL_58_11 TaxID=1817867 RepID=A0A1F5Z3D1_9BACT|nr:MAG: hypothetical protein A3F83_15180 [Candidatus Glassbacteria bacterium RIFCSPLOWO2_12_FULL_58_11]
MTDPRTCCRKLRKYKYQLTEDYRIDLEIQVEEEIDTEFLRLTVDRELTVKKKYAWDGPSGPTFDTKSFMRGALVHDALYQLMRGKYLDFREHREYADRLLKEICRCDGMNRLRAWYVYKMVRAFGEKSARPGPKKQAAVICAP